MTAELRPAGAPEAARIDATGTQRRMQAMVANGRPLAEIAEQLGRGQEPRPHPVPGDRPRRDRRAVSGLYRRSVTGFRSRDPG